MHVFFSFFLFLVCFRLIWRTLKHLRLKLNVHNRTCQLHSHSLGFWGSFKTADRKAIHRWLTSCLLSVRKWKMHKKPYPSFQTCILEVMYAALCLSVMKTFECIASLLVCFIVHLWYVFKVCSQKIYIFCFIRIHFVSNNLGEKSFSCIQHIIVMIILNENYFTY